MTRTELAKACLEKYGADAQITKTIEECAELIQKLCHYKIGRFVQDQVAEKIADCRAMLDQMDIIFGEETVEKWRKIKHYHMVGRLGI
jgi:NTP pyrophosphatase (non-canonical NTP hydrolase)